MNINIDRHCNRTDQTEAEQVAESGQEANVANIMLREVMVHTYQVTPC